jgi:hypothetical protein
MKKNHLKARYWLLSVLTAAIGCMLHVTYAGVERRCIADFQARQKVLAQQAARGVEQHFANLSRSLTWLAGMPDVVAMTPAGQDLLEAFQRHHADGILAIRRVDAGGVIVATAPRRPAAVGTDISRQRHVRRILRERRPVISDVSEAVQGVASIALHVPVVADGRFAGSLGARIPFQTITESCLSRLQMGDGGHARLLGENGVELFGPSPAHAARNPMGALTGNPERRALAREMMDGNAGTCTVLEPDADGRPQPQQTVYLPIRV